MAASRKGVTSSSSSSLRVLLWFLLLAQLHLLPRPVVGAGGDDVVTYVLEPFEDDAAQDIVVVVENDEVYATTTTDALFGGQALQVDYDFPPDVETTTSVESILKTNRIHNVYGSDFVSFWYRMGAEAGPVPEVRVSLIDSNLCNVTADDDGGCELETWEYGDSVSLTNGTEWHQVRLPTSSSRWSRAKGENNGRLDLDRIR